MKFNYKVGDVVRAYTDDRKISWRGTIIFIGPTNPPYSNNNPMLFEYHCWVRWDNGNESRKTMNHADPNYLEMDKEYLRNIKLKELLK